MQKIAETLVEHSATVRHCSNEFWEGIKITEHVFPTMHLQSYDNAGHRIAFNLGGAVMVNLKTIYGTRQKIYPAGSFGIVPRGDYNTIGWTKELRVLVADLDPSYAENMFEIENISFKQHRGVEDATSYKFARLFRDELPYLNIAGKIYGQSITTAFVSHLVTNYAEINKKVIAAKGKLSAQQLKSVIEYCNDTLSGSPRLEDLSGCACLSNFHFLRLFKQTLGITPHKYVLQIKVEKAKQLISEKKLNHSEIAGRLGFVDQSHFCKAFKKVTGVAPKAFLPG